MVGSITSTINSALYGTVGGISPTFSASTIETLTATAVAPEIPDDLEVNYNGTNVNLSDLVQGALASHQSVGLYEGLTNTASYDLLQSAYGTSSSGTTSILETVYQTSADLDLLA